MTMDPFAGPQSPRTQSFAGGGAQGPVSVEDAFVDGFTQMAYDTFTKAHPSLMKDTVTFRALDSDPDDGSGLGVFILAVNQEIFYVPVVVADNTVKPIDMFYSRRLNRYFPLTPEWLVEANKSALNELGHGVKPPKHLQNDVDITRVVEPPMTGRYGFASDKTAQFRSKVASDAANGLLDRDAKHAFAWAARYDGSAKRASVLPELLAGLPDGAKVAFARVLQGRPNVLRKMAALYGVKAVTSALQVSAPKVASHAGPRLKPVYVASSKTAAEEMRAQLGSETPRAFAATRSTGFYAKDRRAKADGVAYVEEGDLQLAQPKTSGFYRVFTTSGPEEALVLVRPKMSNSYGEVSMYRPRSSAAEDRASTATVVFKDGRCMQSVPTTFVAEPIVCSDDAGFQKMLEDWTVERPANGDHGLFVSAGRGDPLSTESMTVKSSRSAGSETTYTSEWGPVVVVSLAMRGPTIAAPPRSNRIALSREFRWLKTKKEWLDKGELYSSPAEVMRAVEANLTKGGSKKVAVKLAANATFYVGGSNRPLPIAEAAEKIATDYGISLPATVAVLRGAVLFPKRAYWTKRAADDKKKSAPPDDGGDGQDPNAMPMDPAAMAAMQGPPQPSGYELAIAEQLQLIQSQIAALNDKSMTLQQLQMRQQQIDGGGGMMAAPTGAASLMAGAPMGPMGGMPMTPPSAQPGGMDPNMMMQGGAMPPTGQPPMAPGMDPSAMQQGGMQPPGGMPMDPSMMQQGGMPVDPSMMQQPDPTDPAVMRPSITSQDIDSGNIQQSINPAFLDMAGDLQQADVFDAAAIASLAQNKNLRSIVQSHLPRAEETLDNLGRMKLLFDLREGKIKSSIGNDTYTDMTQTLRDVFSQLGDLLLKLNQTSDQLLPAAIG